MNHGIALLFGAPADEAKKKLFDAFQNRTREYYESTEHKWDDYERVFFEKVVLGHQPDDPSILSAFFSVMLETAVTIRKYDYGVTLFEGYRVAAIAIDAQDIIDENGDCANWPPTEKAIRASMSGLALSMGREWVYYCDPKDVVYLES